LGRRRGVPAPPDAETTARDPTAIGVRGLQPAGAAVADATPQTLDSRSRGAAHRSHYATGCRAHDLDGTERTRACGRGAVRAHPARAALRARNLSYPNTWSSINCMTSVAARRSVASNSGASLMSSGPC